MYIVINDVLFVVDVNPVYTSIKTMTRFWEDGSVNKALDLHT